MKKKNIFVDLLEVVVLSVILANLLFHFVLISAKVNGTSMYPNLKDGDFGYSFILTRNIRINRFDICVIKVGDKNLVKRVVGLPGETLVYSDGKLYVNGTYVEEAFLKDVETSDFDVVLNDDEYFCLGDNRPVSRDSRSYGAFKDEDIISTHLMIVYPLADFGFKK